ncbi:Peptidase aspartic putative domain-containing protein [Camponotus japonicus]
MATIESVIERQHQLFGVISRAVDNLKKLGPSKTNRGNVQSRMEALKANWEKFQNNHQSLFKSCSGEQRKLPYFKEDLYSVCEEEFIEAHGTLLNTLDSLSPAANQTTPSTEISLNSSATTRSRRLPRIDLPTLLAVESFS